MKASIHVFLIVENQIITNTTTKHPTNPMNQGIIKDRKFTLFFRSLHLRSNGLLSYLYNIIYL